MCLLKWLPAGKKEMGRRRRTLPPLLGDSTVIEEQGKADVK
jgi:hypothetical protein